MNKFILGFLCLTGIHAAAQVCVSTDPVSVGEFDKVYWASKPIAVQALQNKPSVVNCTLLANKGNIIDNAIMCWGWDPCKTMMARQQEGYTWVPSLLQPPVECAPGVNCKALGLPNYNPSIIPLGAIRVSLHFSDYPSITPKPTPGPVITDPVGVSEGAGFYGSTTADNLIKYINGAKYTDSRGTFTKHVATTPFGNEVYWTLNQ